MTNTLPTLTGTEKQIAWANDIREESIARWTKAIENTEFDDARPLVIPAMKRAVEIALACDCASTWIDARDNIMNFSYIAVCANDDGRYKIQQQYEMLGLVFDRNGKWQFETVRSNLNAKY